MFHVSDGLYFVRNNDGSVMIIKTDDGQWPVFGDTGEYYVPKPIKGNIAFTTTLDASSWASVVLSMSAFSERPGDWDAWMRHHKGEEDLLVGKRGGY